MFHYGLPLQTKSFIAVLQQLYAKARPFAKATENHVAGSVENVFVETLDVEGDNVRDCCAVVIRV